MIILAVLFYWKFVYYKYHKKLFTPLSFVLLGGIAGAIGFYNLIIKKNISFSDFVIIFIVFSSFTALSFSLIFLGWKRRGLIRGVDITLYYINKYLGKLFVYIAVIITIPVFYFDMAGTYSILGKEHIILWLMVLGAWVVSNIRLIKREILE